MFYLMFQHSCVVLTFLNINVNQTSTCSNLILFLSRNNKYTKPFSGEFLFQYLISLHASLQFLKVSCFVLQLSAKIAPTKASAAQGQAEPHGPAEAHSVLLQPLCAPPAPRAPFFLLSLVRSSCSFLGGPPCKQDAFHAGFMDSGGISGCGRQRLIAFSSLSVQHFAYDNLTCTSSDWKSRI